MTTNRTPIVSIIITSYNHEAYIKRAIDSVMSQTYDNFELYITDDGSKDNSVKIIKDTISSYENDSRIHFIQYNQNAGFAWHDEILPKLIGRYICILGGDDFFLPDKISKQVSFLEENQEYAGCCTWLEIECDDPSRKKTLQKWFNRSFENRYKTLRSLITGGNFINSPSMMMRLEIYKDKGGYNFGYRQIQDYALFLNILLDYPIAIIQEPLAHYTIHEGSLSNPNSDNNSISALLSCEKEDILFKIIEKMDDKVFLNTFGQSSDGLSREPADIKCLKFIMCKTSNDTVFHQIAIRLYHSYMYDTDVNNLLRQKYNLTRTDIHKFITEKTLYNISDRSKSKEETIYTDSDDAVLVDELLNIFDGVIDKPINEQHLSALYRICKSSDSGVDQYVRLINELSVRKLL